MDCLNWKRSWTDSKSLSKKNSTFVGVVVVVVEVVVVEVVEEVVVDEVVVDVLKVVVGTVDVSVI